MHYIAQNKTYTQLQVNLHIQIEQSCNKLYLLSRFKVVIFSFGCSRLSRPFDIIVVDKIYTDLSEQR